METYAKSVANNDKVELVHLSYDRTAEAATKWAAKEKFAWPTVLPKKVKGTKLEKYTGNYVPDYVLVNKDGKQLAKGKDEVFAKVAELTK